ncbi:precorrin-2 C(20)-methyltransferase [Aneurinibacillus sp. REN35]|uniref:precorrin-2 C(20)-methyltransferase n=1 Tax=Aneurinibacillus sp. REN35 TaxID=3237286 RepID=UPI003528CA32
MATGTLYGVGVGPGDPELVTVKAYRIMKESKVIAYPRKRKGSKSYAYAIAEQYIDQQDKEMLGLVFPMTKDQAILDREWGQTVAQVYERLAQGHDVAFITEGDPMLYSTFIHMMRLMQEKHPDVPVISIPGISSVNGVASRLGLPLADGDEHVAVIPATDDREQMKRALLGHDCVVFIKVAKVIDMMVDLLDELGLLTKASVVTKVTSGEEVVWPNVAELRGLELEYLTLMVVRK